MNESCSTSTVPDSWLGAHAKATGAGHIRRDLPCQDNAATGHEPRPFLIVCDGRGSASRSEEGSERAVTAFERAMAALSPLLIASLDDAPDAEQATRRWAMTAETLVTTTATEQWLLARESETKASPKDFEFTMVAAVVGKQYLGWLRVGDSQLVAIRNGIAGLVDVSEEFEWTNQTCFVRYGRDAGNGLSHGIFPTAETNALFAFSDGVAPRVLDRGFFPRKIFRQLHSSAQEDPEQIAASLHSLLNRDDWSPQVQDDRCLATLWKATQSTLPSISALPVPKKAASRKPVNSATTSKATVAPKQHKQPFVAWLIVTLFISLLALLPLLMHSLEYTSEKSLTNSDSKPRTREMAIAPGSTIVIRPLTFSTLPETPMELEATTSKPGSDTEVSEPLLPQIFDTSPKGISVQNQKIKDATEDPTEE